MVLKLLQLLDAIEPARKNLVGGCVMWLCRNLKFCKIIHFGVCFLDVCAKFPFVATVVAPNCIGVKNEMKILHKKMFMKKIHMKSLRNVGLLFEIFDAEI